jgi:transposase
MAAIGDAWVRDLAAASDQVIRVDAAWFAIDLLDMRAGADTALARVVSVLGEGHARSAQQFA